MHTPRILLVVTSSDHMGTAPEPTGLWLEEVAAPYYAFLDAKYDVALASPLGGQAPIDPRSNAEASQTASTRRFCADSKAQHALAHTMKLGALSLADYDAVFFAGGHGTMNDFATDASVRQCVQHFWQAKKPLAAVCHGPAALVQATDEQGHALVAGHRLTAFSDEEERIAELDRYVPFALESRLRALGATYSSAKPFAVHVVVDGPLVTGQNPASSIPVAEALIHLLRNRAPVAHAA